MKEQDSLAISLTKARDVLRGIADDTGHRLKYIKWLQSFKPQRQPANLIAIIFIALATAEIVWYVLNYMV